MKKISKRQKVKNLETQLAVEKDSFQSYWKDLSKYILPRRAQFIVGKSNGDRRGLDILDNTATISARVISSGIMTGVTSPARSWFKLRSNIAGLNKSSAVKAYFDEVAELIRDTFLKSNLYNVLPTVYADMSTFGTGCLYMEEDFKSVMNFYCFPIGTYSIGNNRKGEVNLFQREFEMTVRQIVDKFGKKNLSISVLNKIANGSFEAKVPVSHMIMPNDDADASRPESKYKKYISYYYESASSPDSGVMLSEKGYDYFPVMAVRWEAVGGDSYGTQCPGMLCLGDVKQLQKQEADIAYAIKQKVKPALVASTGLRSKRISMLPGEITYSDEENGQQSVRPLFNVNFDIRELEGKQEQLRSRIKETYFVNLFLQISSSDRRQITAREIDERHQEKLLGLGPVLERINQDLLDHLVENAFSMLDKQDLLPELPEELEGVDYSIEYISIMAQAQKLASLGKIEQLFGFAGQIASVEGSKAAEKLSYEKAIEVYADTLGVEEGIVNSEEVMEAIREAQAAAAQQQQQQASAQEAIAAGKTLSETKLTEDNALSQLLGGQ